MAGTRTAGIDWASEAHEVCISEEGEAVERFSVIHDERGIAGLARRLTKLGVDRVAIERPDGILVERLLDVDGRAGATVEACGVLLVMVTRPPRSVVIRMSVVLPSGCVSLAPTPIASGHSFPTPRRPRH